MTTKSQDEGLQEVLFSNILKSHDMQFLLDYIQDNFTPEQVFTEKQLNQWAYENDFIAHDSV